MEQTQKKDLIVRATVADLTGLTAARAAVYRSITVKAAVALVGEDFHEIAAALPVRVQAASLVAGQSKDVTLNIVNGTCELDESDKPRSCFLIVNGVLTVRPGAQPALDAMVGGIINGVVYCPKSLSAALSRFTVNGTSELYPDGAVLRAKPLTVDRRFLLKARKGDCYWCTGAAYLTDPALDCSALTEKGVRLHAATAYVCESKAALAAELFDETTDLIFLPDGCAVVDEEVSCLTPALVRKYGEQLYFSGSLFLDAAETGRALEQVAYLEVAGDVYLDESLDEAFYAKCKQYGGSVYRFSGIFLQGQGKLLVTEHLLREQLTLVGCGAVQIAPEVSPELLREKLCAVRDCGAVLCTEEQKGVLLAVCEDCGFVGPRKKDDAPRQADPEDAVVVETTNYKF